MTFIQIIELYKKIVIESGRLSADRMLKAYDIDPITSNHISASVDDNGEYIRIV